MQREQVEQNTSHHDYRLIVQAVCVYGVSGACRAETSTSVSGRTTTETEDQVKGGLLLNVVITQSSPVLQLFASKDESLLIGWNALLILNFGLHVVDGVRRFNLQRDRLARQGLDEDLHLSRYGRVNPMCML